jgi:hypothetical protein
MRPTLLCLFVFLGLILSAQKITFEPDWLPPAVGDKKWKPLVGFDSRRSSFDDRKVKFIGLRLGAQHRGVHRFGLGFYRMNRGEIYDGILVDRPDASADAEVQYIAGFATLFYERVIMQAGKLELATPIYIGGGTVEELYKDVAGTFRPFVQEPFSVLGFGVMAKYRIFHWIEPGFGGGMRFIYNSRPEVVRTLQRPYYAFKVSILLGEFYRHVIRNDSD